MALQVGFKFLLEQKQRKTLPAAQMEIKIKRKEMLTIDDSWQETINLHKMSYLSLS